MISDNFIAKDFIFYSVIVVLRLLRKNYILLVHTFKFLGYRYIYFNSLLSFIRIKCTSYSLQVWQCLQESQILKLLKEVICLYTVYKGLHP